MDARGFNEILRVLPTPTLILRPENSNYIIVEVNDAYLKIGDFDRESLLGKDFFSAFPNNPYLEIPEWQASLKRVMENKVPDRVPTKQYVGFFKNEIRVRFFDVENVPVLSDDNEVTYIVRSVNDVTAVVEADERRRGALDRLVSREKFLNETQRVGTSGGWEVDLVSNKVTWSEIQREIHEVGEDYEPTMINLINFFNEETDRAMMTGLINDAIHHGRLFDVELRIVTAKGNQRLVRTTGKAEFRDGKCIRIYGVTQDITDRRGIELALDESRNRYQALLDSVDGIVWEAEAHSLNPTFVSEQVWKILGYSSQQMQASPDFAIGLLHPQDRGIVLKSLKDKTQKFDHYNYEFRIRRSNGQYAWMKSYVSVVKQKHKPDLLRGLTIDITINKRISEIDYLERRILELNSMPDISVKEVLTAYVSGIQGIFPRMQCSVLRVQHNKLFTWAAPSLPKAYINAIEGLDIGKSIGSCGAAAFLKQQVIVDDIEHDFRWATFRSVALKANLRACWSYPIMSSKGEVMATFGIYYNEPKAPEEEEIAVVARATSLLSIILENRITAERMEASTELMNQSQKLANFGNWVWDVNHHEVTWSDSLFQIYGLDKNTFKPSFESYLKILHKDDHERVSASIGKVLSTKQVNQFEERIIRPDGEVRLLKSWSSPKLDKKGSVTELIGASIDVTEKRQAEERLMASESRLRSLVETQTMYVIRVDFFGLYSYCNHKYQEDFGWIYDDRDIIGQEAKKTVFDYHHQRLYDIGERCIHHPNEVFEIEVHKLSKNGGVRHTLWHMVCLTDASGLPQEMQCTGIDITKWKLAEEQLILSNEKYRFVNKATNDAIYDWEIENDSIEWGDGYERLFGYVNHKEGFAINNWSSEIHPDEVNGIVDYLNEVLKDPNEHNWTAAYRYRKADGEYAYVEEVGYIVRNGDGKAIRMIGVLRDVTQSRIAESERRDLNLKLQHNLEKMAQANADLAESRQCYKDLFHYSPQPMYVYDLESLMFVDVNEAAIQFYGYSHQEFLLMDITKLRPVEDIPKLLIAVKNAENGIFYNHGVLRHLKKNGDIVYVDVQTSAIKYNAKSTNLVLAKDISDRINYLSAVENQNAVLKEISWMQSHVVRAPLSKLMSLIELIKLDKNISKEDKELLHYIMSSANELDEIIRDISKKTEMASLRLPN